MPAIFVGLMSGTSLDGIDAAVTDFSEHAPRLLATDHAPFDAGLRAALLDLNEPASGELHRAALAGLGLARAYADSVRRVLAKASVSASAVQAIGCHGQTVRHRPADGYTLQLVNGAQLTELTGITTVCDFRSRDIAAGGQGAPLVPAFHAHALGDPREHRTIVNVGGIANLTDLPPAGPVCGFDCGPGNLLMDAWIANRRGEPFDIDGRWAVSGSVLPALLARMLADPYFARRPPKSAGREEFNFAWLSGHLTGAERPEDVQATLLEFTACAIADAIGHHCGSAQSVYVCGGGARNKALLARIGALLAPRSVTTTESLGFAPEWVEALAFAWLAQRALAHEPGNLPAVTGARGPRVLGAIYPA